MSDPLISLILATVLMVILVWFFWPDSGIFGRWQRSRHLNERVRREDALKHIHQCEIHDQHPTIQSLAGALNMSSNDVTEILGALETSELLRFDGGAFSLTPSGRDYALQIIRSHRLWERYLADATGFGEEEWHGQAEMFEHQLTPDDANRLSAKLGHPTHDPHGDPIPTASGKMVYSARVPLSSMEVNELATIVHIEDEPEAVYAQLVAEGLHVGMAVRLIESTAQRVRFWSAGDEHTLAPLIAANVAVQPTPDEQPEDEFIGETLTNLLPGQKGQVISISPQIRGVERRRLMDLGVIPGTIIQNEINSPMGDPTAYRIRGA
ncbi:MAG: iron dependent repressor, metal binding and dimerization domain protein, partial [Chloroflexota bacterium]